MIGCVTSLKYFEDVIFWKIYAFWHVCEIDRYECEGNVLNTQTWRVNHSHTQYQLTNAKKKSAVTKGATMEIESQRGKSWYKEFEAVFNTIFKSYRHVVVVWAFVGCCCWLFVIIVVFIPFDTVWYGSTAWITVCRSLNIRMCALLRDTIHSRIT